MALPCFWLFFFSVWNKNPKTDHFQEKKKPAKQQQNVQGQLMGEPGKNKDNEFVNIVYLP